MGMCFSLSFAERARAQIEEALGADNTFFTGQAVGRLPTEVEKVDHWLHHGGPEGFARREQEDGLIKPKQS